jgi:hypothetical protein
MPEPHRSPEPYKLTHPFALNIQRYRHLKAPWTLEENGGKKEGEGNE